MLIKAAGMLLIFTACAAAGLFRASALSKRVRQLEGFIDALDVISNEIRYFASPVEAIMEKVDSLEEFHRLKVFGICRKRLLAEPDFLRAWEFSLREASAQLSIDEGDFETLLWFGKLLGATDIEGQTANCERYGALLRQRLNLAREDQSKRGRMYSSLGVLAGVFIAVILL